MKGLSVFDGEAVQLPDICEELLKADHADAGGGFILRRPLVVHTDRKADSHGRDKERLL